ncbi:MAG: adenine phosphoribosyltransferase [Methylobacteriaceae bacterium]|nr:adenine phosphoribosyltransferase [Methylobacteriaceae bacterium]
MSDDVTGKLRDAIRSIPDYPKPGVIFRDITTLLGNADAFHLAVEELAEPWRGKQIKHVAGIEARGLILGGAMAYCLHAGFIPIRKKGKLPRKTVRIAYDLEYGQDELEIHVDAVNPGDAIFLVDDLIATGGTAIAAVELIHQLGAEVAGAGFIIDLPDLGGAKKLRAMGVNVHSLVSFEGD